MDSARRLLREHPEIGLFVGVVLALVPASLIWVQVAFAPPGLLRVLGGLAGAVACCAFLASGPAWAKVPLSSEVPQCRRKATPYHRLTLAAHAAVAVQIALASIAITTG